MKAITAFAVLLAGVHGTALPQTPATPSGKGVQKPSAPASFGKQVSQGCFSAKGSDFQIMDGVLYPTEGGCIKDVCWAQNFKVGGQTGGNQCYCGNKYPPNSTRVDDALCNAPCQGYDFEACGSIDGTIFTVYNTGRSIAVEFSVEDTPKPSNTPPPSAATTNPGSSGATTITKSSTPDPNAGNGGGGGGNNTAGIAAGAVVGVVAIAGIIGAVLFYLRRKRNREIEEEHRRNAAVNSFMSSGKPPGSSGGHSSTDSRLDPVLAQRRVSNGSIADNEDYSRKILRVTNA